MRQGRISACMLFISGMSNHLKFPMMLPVLFLKIVCCKMFCLRQTRACGHTLSLRHSILKKTGKVFFQLTHLHLTFDKINFLTGCWIEVSHGSYLRRLLQRVCFIRANKKGVKMKWHYNYHDKNDRSF